MESSAPPFDIDRHPGWYRGFGKRAIDLVLGVLGLVILSPVLLVTALVVRIRLGSPVLFRQERPGLGGRPFRLVKFRTMTDERGPDGNLLPDASRLTRLGSILRETSLDELPELWNVVTGDMSCVGPRPLLMQYLARFDARQARRHEVRPGITGWAQVNGRNLVAWSDRLEMDVWYVENLSLAVDLKILGMTVMRVATRHGISADGDATMPEFTGSQPTGTAARGTEVHTSHPTP